MRKIDGSNILLVIHEGIADDWKNLIREFATDSKGRVIDTLELYLRDKLDHLHNLGFIEFDEDPNSPDKIRGKIGITKHWTRTHKILGGQALDELADLSSGGLVVRPLLGRPQRIADPADLFVLMPFQEDLKPVYDDHIKNVARRLKLSVKRADDFFTAHHVMSDVWEGICMAHAVVADCTDRNPNVFYEIGLAHVIGKPVILITQNRDDVPFDLGQIRFIPYELTPRGMTDFEQKLEKTLQTELGLKRDKEV
jgi:hypothetical protein